MRNVHPVWILLPLLGGCEAAGPATAASVASVVAFGRDPADLVVSLATGRDCSILRLGQSESYCKPIDPPPLPQEYCTRSLGTPDCWDKPNPFGYYQQPLADGPQALTAAQDRNRTARWPDH
jgi:hypothetical protein